VTTPTQNPISIRAVYQAQTATLPLMKNASNF